MWPNHSGSVGPVLAGTNVATMDPKPYVLPPPATPPRRPPKRSNELVGVHFESPKRRRPMRKDSALVVRPGLARREKELTSRLDALLGKDKGFIPSLDEGFETPDSCGSFAGVMGEGEDAEQPAQLPLPENILDSVRESSQEKQAPSRRVAPGQAVQRLYNNWLALIPTLEGAYLSYMQHAQGRLGRQPQGEPRHCVSRRCVARSSPVQCLYADCTWIHYDAVFKLICDFQTSSQSTLIPANVSRLHRPSSAKDFSPHLRLSLV